MKELTLEKTIFIPSKSRYDLSIDKWGNEEEAAKRFLKEGRWKTVVDSDERQKRNLARLHDRIPEARIIDRAGLTDHALASNDLFVFVGGDNHFTYCSQAVLKYMKDHPEADKYVAGVLLDPVKSYGALLHFGMHDFLDSLKKLEKGEYQVERWTTLEARVENHDKDFEPHPAVGDYFIGEYCNLLMSRNEAFNAAAIVEGLQIMPEKTSGIMVVTGAGSGPGSWYDNIHQCYFGEPDEFSREERVARVIARENKARAKYTLQEGQSLSIVSYNDDRGIISPDSHERNSASFGMGSKATIWISDLRLPVIKVGEVRRCQKTSPDSV
ncbi:MAG: hypothetical protein KJ709_09030 [Nanoarchaeota archaeon]|nr:hypothetical protein [Nanoarchaeota archaeon]